MGSWESGTERQGRLLTTYEIHRFIEKGHNGYIFLGHRISVRFLFL